MGQTEVPPSVVPPAVNLTKVSDPANTVELPKPKQGPLRRLDGRAIPVALYERIRVLQERKYPKATAWEFATFLLETAVGEFEEAEKRATLAAKREGVIITPPDRLVVTPEEATREAQHVRTIVRD